jgi:hypothetical protein
MVEGPTRVSRHDVSHQVTETIENIARRNAQRCKSSVGKHIITFHIALWVVAHRMGFAINFDREPAFKTSKVSDVTTIRELTPEAEPVGTLAKLLPQHNLGQRQLTAKPTRGADVFLR